ncbi:hypothetical protein COZ14_01325, partial [Candidatus Dojkabacteria bacterium CG_4_10_14_3_um_filter_Dojkabacteria_WS6_41_9]
IDSSIPNGTITINSGATITNNPNVVLSLQAIDNVAGVSHMNVCDNETFLGCSYVTYEANKTLTLGGYDGSKTLYVKYKDYAGNESDIFSSSIVLDTVPPKLAILPLLPSIITTETFTFTGYAFGGIAGDYTETLLTSDNYNNDGANKVWNEDDNSWQYTFTDNFKFPFFGQDFGSVQVSSNGRLCFISGSNLTTGGLNDTTCGPFIAPFWTDLGKSDLTNKISIKQTDDSVHVAWKDLFTNTTPNSGVSPGGVAQNWKADEDAWSYSLPFSFPYYGTSFTNIRISPNGTILFGDAGNANWYKPGWTSKAAAPGTLMAASSGVIGNEIYITGSVNTNWDMVGALYVYNIETGEWRTGPSMPVAHGQTIGGVMNGKFYVFGGRTGTLSTATSDVYEYDPATELWNQKTSMNYARKSPVGAVYDGKFYALGGFDENGAPQLDMEVFDPVANTWTVMTPPPDIQLTGASAQFIQGKLYVAGGTTSGTNPFSDTLYVYDLTNDNWTAETSMPKRLAGGATAVMNGKFMYIGGTDESWDSVNDIFVFNPALHTWNSGLSLPLELHRTVAQSVGGILYVVGGRDINWDAVDTTYVYQEGTSSISEVHDVPYLVPLGADLRTDGGGQPNEDIYVANNGDNVSIIWNAEESSTGNPVTVEAVLYSNGKIRYNYGDQPVPPLNTGALVGVSRGDGIHYTASEYNTRTEIDNLTSKIFTYAGSQYTETSATVINEDITFDIEAVLHVDGDIGFNYGDSYSFAQIYNHALPVIGISKGDGTNYLTSAISGSKFNTVVTKSVLWEEKAGSSITSASYKIDGEEVSNSCTPSDGVFDTFKELFTCSVNLSNGSHQLKVTSVDSANNSGELLTDYFTVDTVSPTGSITINAGALFTNNKTTTLSISATDATTSVTNMLLSEVADLAGASWEAYNTPKTFTLTGADGEKPVYVKYKDAAGNESEVVSDTIVLDTTKPTVKITNLGLIDNVPDKTSLFYYFTSQTPHIKGTTEAKSTVHF